MTNDGLMPEKTEEPDVKTESDKGQQTGSKNESGNASAQTAFVNQEHVADPAAVKTPENVPEFSRQLDTLDLIRQVTEFTKITVREAQTTMEMQLNPEHLGKIYIEVTTKERTGKRSVRSADGRTQTEYEPGRCEGGCRRSYGWKP